MDRKIELGDHIVDVARSSCNVVVHTNNWYADLVSQAIMDSDLASLVMTAFPQKYKILLISHDKDKAHQLEGGLIEAVKRYKEKDIGR